MKFFNQLFFVVIFCCSSLSVKVASVDIPGGDDGFGGGCARSSDTVSVKSDNWADWDVLLEEMDRMVLVDGNSEPGQDECRLPEFVTGSGRLGLLRPVDLTEYAGLYVQEFLEMAESGTDAMRRILGRSVFGLECNFEKIRHMLKKLLYLAIRQGCRPRPGFENVTMLFVNVLNYIERISPEMISRIMNLQFPACRGRCSYVFKRHGFCMCKLTPLQAAMWNKRSDLCLELARFGMRIDDEDPGIRFVYYSRTGNTSELNKLLDSGMSTIIATEEGFSGSVLRNIISAGHFSGSETPLLALLRTRMCHLERMMRELVEDIQMRQLSSAEQESCALMLPKIKSSSNRPGTARAIRQIGDLYLSR
jgi:hypothetical protein